MMTLSIFDIVAIVRIADVLASYSLYIHTCRIFHYNATLVKSFPLLAEPAVSPHCSESIRGNKSFALSLFLQ